MMAKPTQSKDAKPKAEGEEDGNSTDTAEKGGGGLNIVNLAITALLIVICTTVSSAASVYFLMPMVLKPMMASLAPAKDGDGDGGDAASAGEAPAAKMPTVGPVISLDEFTVNLKEKESEAQHYLRADISITVTPDDPKFEALAGEAMKKWEEDFKLEMAHYVPAIRDIVISSLTKRSSEELSSEQGKENLKQEIQKNVDGLLQGKHKVISVNLENFIIQ